MKKEFLKLMMIAIIIFFVSVFKMTAVITDSEVILSVQQQTRTITGTVFDETGEPLPGSSIAVKGTSIGTVSDAYGKFTINQVPANAVLVVNFLGYIAQEIPVGDQSDFTIRLLEDSQLLEEVVVIGYGTVKKSDLTGSVASVKAEQLTKIATYSPVAALQGRAAGVSVALNSGAPDASAEIFIRGIGTTNTNNASPLYVVDGFPMSSMNFLSPQDIESIEILKDASSTAIYGSRGSNGVVMVTTKKGQAGSVKVEFSGYYGIENLSKVPTMLNARQYAEMSNLAIYNNNPNQEPPYPNLNNLAADTKWWDEVSQLGQMQNYTVRLSGGTDRISSSFSTNYFGREGIIKASSFERLTFNQSSTVKATNFLTFSSSFTGAFLKTQSNDPYNSIFTSSLVAPPDVPVWNEDTNYYSGITKFRMGNPVGQIARTNGYDRRNNLVGNFNAILNITKDLTFNSRFGVRYDGSWGDGFSPIYFETANISELVASVRRETSKTIDWNWTNTMTYHKNFNDVHDLTVMGTMEAREYYYEEFSASKKNMPVEGEAFHYFNSVTDMNNISGSAQELAMLSYIGRIQYNLLNRYLLTMSIRADGSSRFVGDNRWGYFPSAAVAWRLTEENFIKNLDAWWLTNAKIRLTYGQNGNEGIGDYYPYNTPIRQEQFYTIGRTPVRANGALPNGIGNPEAKWETQVSTNFGLDLSLFNGKWNVVADYFIRKTDDLLLSQSIPRISGFSTMTRNVGGIENKGLELTLTYRDKKGDFSYEVSAVASFIKNKITNLGTTEALTANFPYDYTLIDMQANFNNCIRSVVGEPYRNFWGYKTDGIFQNQAEIDAYVHTNGNKIQANAAPGDFKFLDLNGNGSIDNGDMTWIGDSHADVDYGLHFDASYKKFDLSLSFTGVYGKDILNASKFYFMRFDGRHNVKADYLDAYWRGEGTTNSEPIITSDISRNDRNFRLSDYYIEDGSYLRLKSLQLGYNFSPNLSGSFKPNIRFYISAQNLFTITKYSGNEVEITGQSIDRGQYPQPRVFMIGTTINF